MTLPGRYDIIINKPLAPADLKLINVKLLSLFAVMLQMQLTRVRNFPL